jgi:hypothetical protein
MLLMKLLHVWEIWRGIQHRIETMFFQPGGCFSDLVVLFSGEVVDGGSV